MRCATAVDARHVRSMKSGGFATTTVSHAIGV
jgi:hypothetical protein